MTDCAPARICIVPAAYRVSSLHGNRQGASMRFRVRKSAHVLERIGLAMAGAACGLFVSAHVGSTISFLTTQGFLLFMMIAGAAGFYLGIDTPALPLHAKVEPAR